MDIVETIAEHTLSVSQATDLLNGILSPLTLTIEGEISGYKVSQGKFVFFDLKDSEAVLSCFMMRFNLPFDLEDGMQVKVTATPKIRPQSGRLSLTVQAVEVMGDGALQKAFEELRKKLETEGVFDRQWKKPLPMFPKTIGLITSPSGDALQDMLRIMRNRSGGLKLILAGVAVQGQIAVPSVVSAIRYFNSHHPVDVIIIARGGGSLEDLQAFNSEPVVRAIFASNIPIITGVGHEPDVTLVDFVADVRAATPTNAAEIAVPDFDQLGDDLSHLQLRLMRGVKSFISEQRPALDQMLHRLLQALTGHFRRTDVLKERLLFQLKQRERLFWTHRSSILELSQQMKSIQSQIIEKERQNLELMAQALRTLNPENILARGYAIATNSRGKIITKVSHASTGERIDVRVSDGSIGAEVKPAHVQLEMEV